MRLCWLFGPSPRAFRAQWSFRLASCFQHPFHSIVHGRHRHPPPLLMLLPVLLLPVLLLPVLLLPVLPVLLPVLLLPFVRLRHLLLAVVRLPG